ncbi:hypothetical protein [Alicyclobacillus acidoterrestris]|uniref:Uncharacterized protein n=1 Tax=Alicyclobacillus acidoterrestris (strain ATCC 49025 / DSM 3922 / CIP 106132 / NCIMB 13137 / GD3B) TaxID=1356854 RepID=T0BSP7_ALIAG|nr:hypothetical protein [Alicyclobacillus acidoterrestris]EPZ43834.1 hypothetical protein N007_12005 [Alicyclobacillus acidoterrestris ATCC 49025]UNO49034.1 hypothetical protein K1I37_00205 [Alicyclobacillus acidoterrestris]
MTTVEMKQSMSNFAPTSNETQQTSHAASPSHQAVASTGLQVVIVIAAFMAGIYGLHIAGRLMKAGSTKTK